MYQTKKIQVGNVIFGGERPVTIAGPCAIESEKQITEISQGLSTIGVDILRGGAFKPRTKPNSFQGLGVEGIKLLYNAGKLIQKPVVSELMDIEHLDVVSKYVDIIQIGSRNMQNYSLLKAVGETQKTVLLKRGMSATYEEWIGAVEYIMSGGNENIILCERGIRTFESYTRNTLDLTAILVLQKETGLPVIVDPSHGTGIKEFIAPMSKASIACGAAGLMIEVHNNPENALCDGKQSLNFDEYRKLVDMSL